MANWKKVDTDVLDADLTTVADAIRERAGTTEGLAFPDGMASAVMGIPDLLKQWLEEKIVEAYHPTLEIPRQYGFLNQKKLQKAEFPNAWTTGYFGFSGCSALTTAIFPKMREISACGFSGCTSLKIIDFPLLRQINDSGLSNSGIEVLTIRNTDGMCALGNVNALTGTPIANGTGYIYVHRKFLSDTDASSDYRRATNWSTYYTQFRALEDYTVDGTTTGALDESKI